MNLRELQHDAGADNRTPIGSGIGSEPERKIQVRELLVFLFLIVPSLVTSFLPVRQGGLSFDFVAWATIVRDLALLTLIAYFLWRNSEPMSRIGWSFQNFTREAALGVALFVPLLVVTSTLERLLQSVGLSAPTTQLPKYLTATGRAELALALLLVVIVAIVEETIFRGYLILRFKTATRSTVAAVLLSTVVFAVGHGYEGTAGVATVGFMGLVLAVVYIWRRSLVAPMVMHFLQDFISIVLVPLLMHK
jgi:membrane protease YdiL (CAAX protease family)